MYDSNHTTKNPVVAVGFSSHHSFHTMNKLTIFLILLFCSAQDVSAKPFEVDGLWYEPTSAETVKVVEEASSSSGGTTFVFRNCYEGDIDIPETVVYGETTYTVTAVEDGTFRELAKLTSISLPATVVDLGTEPFADCPLLDFIAVDADNPAFATSKGLLYDKAFTTLIACPGAVEGEVSVRSSVQTIASSAFRGCEGITKITIPQSATTIGSRAFQGCSDLISVSLPDQLETIADSLFFNCTSLWNQQIPQSVVSVGVRAFHHCSSITTMNLPASLISIGDYAFDLCYGLLSVSFPNGLQKIGKWAFDDCGKIRTLSIPATVEDIASTTFAGCSGLWSFSVASDNASYCSVDGVLFDKEMTTLICYPGLKTGDYTVPDSVTTIGDYAFYYSRQLKNIMLSSSVTTVGANAFRLCTALKRVTMPSSLTALGSGIFVACQSLEAIVCYATEPPVVSATTFTESNLQVPLYVLGQVVDSYKNAEYWSRFVTILPIDGSVVDGLLGDVDDDGFVNMLDVTQIINHILSKPSPGFQWQRADLNFDGYINMLDVSLLISRILGSE